MSQDSYTAEQALQKSCCVGMPTTNPSNMMPCISEKCMAWRWSQSKQTSAFSKRVIEYALANTVTDKGKERPMKWNEAHDYILKHESDNFKRTEGYCGLAGYPHNALKP